MAEFTNEKLSRYVCQYFSDVIVATGRDLEESEHLNDFKAAHKLILQINKFVPSLLLNVIPQLQEELKVENLIIRQFATASIGEMVLESGSKLTFGYPNVWSSWIERYNSLTQDG